MKYSEYKDMRKVFPEEAENGEFRLIHLTLTEERVEQEKRQALWDDEYKEVRGLEAGDYVVLKKGREIVMSNTWMEQSTNIDFVHRANGDVLIAGLGIGMVVLAIQDKPEVTSITIVEKETDVKELVMPYLSKHFNDKVKIVISDINDFIPEQKYDVIYCDIWNDISSSNWDEMKSLTRKFKYKVDRSNSQAFLDHWRKSDVQRMVREDAKDSYGWY